MMPYAYYTLILFLRAFIILVIQDYTVSVWTWIHNVTLTTGSRIDKFLCFLHSFFLLNRSLSRQNSSTHRSRLLSVRLQISTHQMQVGFIGTFIGNPAGVRFTCSSVLSLFYIFFLLSSCLTRHLLLLLKDNEKRFSIVCVLCV